MNSADFVLLSKLGIDVTDMEFTIDGVPVGVKEYACGAPEIKTTGTFTIDENVFRPMCHLIRITDMIVESKNPAVNEMYNHLITMLELTK